ncbi:DUF2726 domain-containing protein [Alteromonas sp. a30]|uniref:DUF2726 domain-containing protein n=1 Tax=Alteromonas sp. a30 TaxID=2730917 RepID=UPI00227FC43C|nr:DUF2726 domain-containing protein [Alteromonas sp. a30]MCY7297071.1 DUF2726 domain-containing protein [Alteromonas sp. a30]
MEWIIILAIIIIVIALLSKGAVKGHSYQIKGPLFTPAERSFLGILDSAVSDKYRIFGKVRVADVMSPKKGMDRKNWQIAFNKISAKHFDYVLCCKDTLKVIAVIELDDKSHKKKSSQTRDKFLESACDSANLKLVRFPAKASYVISEVSEVIENTINPPEPKSV